MTLAAIVSEVEATKPIDEKGSIYLSDNEPARYSQNR